MNISAKGIRLPRTIVIAGISAGIAAFGIIGCASNGPPQISEQNNERCFQQPTGSFYSHYASQAREAAGYAEILAADGGIFSTCW